MRIRGYSFWHCLYLGLSLVLTKIFFFRFRLVRFPIRTRLQGDLVGGDGLTTGVNNRIDVFHGATLRLGKNIEVNDHCHIACAENIRIGDNTLIASRVYISDHDHDLYHSADNPQEWPISTLPVYIGDNCWIGEGVCILKGVHLGDGCVIGANAVVTKSFGEKTVIAGVPGKKIGTRGGGSGGTI